MTIFQERPIWRLALVLILALAGSCDREVPMEDLQAPGIQFITPLQGATVSGRDSVEISVVFTENNQLHEVGVWVWKDSTNEYVTNFLFHSHDTVLAVTRKFYYPVDHATTLRLEAEASDHNGNATDQSVIFQITP